MNECLLAICLALPGLPALPAAPAPGDAPASVIATQATQPAAPILALPADPRLLPPPLVLTTVAADTTPKPARDPNAPRDRLFGEDKFTHFFTTFIFTSLSATGARLAGLGRDESLLVGAGVGVGLGVAKELRDIRDPVGDASFLDLAWDIAGAGAGVAAAAQAR